MPDPQSHTYSTTAPTLLSQLHTLLRSHQLAHSQATLPYLHPYAPSSSSIWKGKGRELSLSSSDRLNIFKQLRETVEAAKGVLSRTGGKDEERERLKLARALREVYVRRFTVHLKPDD